MKKSTKKRNQADIADYHQEETIEKRQKQNNFVTKQGGKTFLNLCKDRTKSGYRIYNVEGKYVFYKHFVLVSTLHIFM